MHTTIARLCNRSLTLTHRAGSSWSARRLGLDTGSSNAAAFSTSRQIRETFLRAGPGRDLGHHIQSDQPSVSMPDSGLAAHDQLGSEVVEADVEIEVKSETTFLPVGPGTHSAQRTNSTPLPPVTYKEIVLLETDFRERFIKGGGNGGQKINKTNSNVELKHHETGIVVQCQATRSLPQNRKLARKILIARLDEYYNGAMSKRGQKAEKLRQRKQRMARKSAKKYHGSNTEVELQDSDEYDVDDAFEDGIGEDDDISQSGDNSKNEAKSGSKLVPKNAIQFTTLEEIMASDNKKASRRKAARKH